MSYKVNLLRNSVALMAGITSGILLTDVIMKPDLSIPEYEAPPLSTASDQESSESAAKSNPKTLCSLSPPNPPPRLARPSSSPIHSCVVYWLHLVALGECEATPHN
ncbi:hypothetical protein BASA50_009480 [Batrachochytrium salamandrivorans]|uniref:Uncharacterized protein n=1 Tax=Batrachochytrium salamandrivorans TaxID=1357716 RepID=A0ABQ8F143_9FUNG|nr:hypothetical protein BASA50_009480 [Batrachochytrium salamandrivorans]